MEQLSPEKISQEQEEERLSNKYKKFPPPSIGWGERVRESHPDQLDETTNPFNSSSQPVQL